MPGYDPVPEHAEQLQGQLRRGRAQGPTPFDPDPVDKSLTQAVYEDALNIPEGATDAEATVKRRREQKFIRDHLLGGHANASCQLCGRTFPQGFLIAAHIKPRKDCSEDERKDVAHIAMLACSFGCDVLYETGVIYVDEAGKVRAGDNAKRVADVDEELARCVGKPCLAHRAGSAAYFRWHRLNVAGVES
ncbi:MAG: hypothetical protein H6741_31710 [Alphaproteobacteria bacterium]|nr:hypothetical protein [Alphaproteobacteria bacterium]